MDKAREIGEKEIKDEEEGEERKKRGPRNAARPAEGALMFKAEEKVGSRFPWSSIFGVAWNR